MILAQIFFNKDKKIFLDKNHQKFAKANLKHVSRESFLTFVINFLFLEILAFLAQKTEILAKIFKNKKLIKKRGEHSLDTRI